MDPVMTRSILLLPDELLAQISTYLPVYAVAVLYATSKRLHRLFYSTQGDETASWILRQLRKFDAAKNAEHSTRGAQLACSACFIAHGMSDFSVDMQAQAPTQRLCLARQQKLPTYGLGSPSYDEIRLMLLLDPSIRYQAVPLGVDSESSYNPRRGDATSSYVIEICPSHDYEIKLSRKLGIGSPWLEPPVSSPEKVPFRDHVVDGPVNFRPCPHMDLITQDSIMRMLRCMEGPGFVRELHCRMCSVARITCKEMTSDWGTKRLHVSVEVTIDLGRLDADITQWSRVTDTRGGQRLPWVVKSRRIGYARSLSSRLDFKGLFSDTHIPFDTRLRFEAFFRRGVVAARARSENQDVISDLKLKQIHDYGFGPIPS